MFLPFLPPFLSLPRPTEPCHFSSLLYAEIYPTFFLTCSSSAVLFHASNSIGASRHLSLSSLRCFFYPRPERSISPPSRLSNSTGRADYLPFPRPPCPHLAFLPYQISFPAKPVFFFPFFTVTCVLVSFHSSCFVRLCACIFPFSSLRLPLLSGRLPTRRQVFFLFPQIPDVFFPVGGMVSIPPSTLFNAAQFLGVPVL